MDQCFLQFINSAGSLRKLRHQVLFTVSVAVTLGRQLLLEEGELVFMTCQPSRLRSHFMYTFPLIPVGVTHRTGGLPDIALAVHSVPDQVD